MAPEAAGRGVVERAVEGVAARRERAGIAAASFLPLLLLAALPVLLARLPPLDDYVNHLARMHVIAVDGRDPLLAQYYRIDWKLVPNLAEDLVVPPLAHVVGVYWAGKLFLIATLALLLSGPQAIHMALFRRASIAPLAAVLFLYNKFFAWGVVNYLFGVGVALWAIAAWIALRRAAPLRRGGVSLGFVLTLYLCHLSALGLYVVGLMGFEAWHARTRRIAWPDMAALLLPFAAVPLLLMLGPERDGGGVPAVWELAAKLQGPWLAVKTYWAAVDVAVCAVAAGLALLAWRRGALRVHPAAWWILAAFVPVYLALPTAVMSAWGADVRLPVGALFIALGFLDWSVPTPAAERRFLLVLLALAAVRVGGVEAAWRRLDRVTADMQASLSLIEPGSRVLAAEASEPPLLPALRYLPSLATIERSSLVAENFANPHQQVLAVREPYRAMTGGYHEPLPSIAELDAPSADGRRAYWRHWRRDYDYLYLLWTAASPAADPAGLERIYAARDFILYRIPHDRAGR
jgi:hypothetical protein